MNRCDTCAHFRCALPLDDGWCERHKATEGAPYLRAEAVGLVKAMVDVYVSRDFGCVLHEPCADGEVAGRLDGW